jgi:hypothetical protein
MDQLNKPFSLFLIIWTGQMQKAAATRGEKAGAEGVGFHALGGDRTPVSNVS